MRKYWGYLVEVSHVTLRKSKASENLGVFMGAVGVYPWLLLGLLWGEHRWRHLYA
jgi:hypothetical protein